ncbi:MAG: hypothetical protein GX089_02680 [Fibrobacter sp.]|jgi:hypothetical protein|nr:hypothetical protein [Fibrobacter sp.]
MASIFTPIEELELFCRFCEKITPAQLDRSIAENGRTLDRNSTFEYYCTKCNKTMCYSGKDLAEQKKPEDETAIPTYSPTGHFLIGETIQHKKFKKGIVVGKDHGAPSKIIVNFEKSGLKKLVQDV